LSFEKSTVERSVPLSLDDALRPSAPPMVPLVLDDPAELPPLEGTDLRGLATTLQEERSR
jgi:hypothetical protein